MLPSLRLLLIPSDRSYRAILTAQALAGHSRDVGYGLGRDPRAILSVHREESRANPRLYSSPCICPSVYQTLSQNERAYRFAYVASSG